MTTHRFLANQLWLDFVNTEPVLDRVQVDLLPGFGDVVAWLGEAGVLGPEAARRALARSAGRRTGSAPDSAPGRSGWRRAARPGPPCWRR